MAKRNHHRDLAMAVPVSRLAMCIALAVEEWEKDNQEVTIPQLLEALETIRHEVTEDYIRDPTKSRKKDN